jgi:hypothetical protein
MTKNEVLYVKQSEIFGLEQKLRESNCYIVKIQGNNIQTKEEFLEFMEEKFMLPDSLGWDSFTDWMTDLSWINNLCFCIIVNDYTDFLKKDDASKKIVLDIFEEEILPFWEKEVTKISVAGKPRSFKVYLVI